MVFVLSRAWDKEKILSTHEESKFRPSDSALRCSTTEPDSTVGEVYFEFEVHVTRVPHTAKISNVDRVMFVKRIAEMVVFYSCHERGTKNIFLYRAQNLPFLLFDLLCNRPRSP